MGVKWRNILAPRGGRRERLARRLRDAVRRLFHRPTAPVSPTSTVANPPPTPKPENVVRVLFQADRFVSGGLEGVVLDIIDVVRAYNCDPWLLVVDDAGPAAEEAQKRGVPVLRLPSSDRRTAYGALLSTYDFDVVNAHYSTFGADLVAARGTPFVQTIHNTYVWLSNEEVADYRAADAHTTRYVCVSANVAAYAVGRMLLSAHKMVVATNGVDTDALDRERRSVDRAALRAALGWADDDFVLLNVGAATPAKAQIPLVRAVARARQENRQVRLAIAGGVADEKYAEALQAEIARLDIADAVMLLGRRDDTHRLCYAADAFVLPSLWEGWSLALMEALYAGLPSIATDVGGARELLTQIGGEIVAPPYDSVVSLDLRRTFAMLDGDHRKFEDALAEAIVRTARAPKRPELPPALRQSFNRAAAYAAYARLFQTLTRRPSPDASGPES